MADIRTKLNKRWNDLEKDRSSYISHYKELQEHIFPRRGRFLTTERNDGSKKHNKILDNAGTLAARTLASGMMAGLTSPARPWFRLSTPDPDLKDFGPVKEWLYAVEVRLREILARSNIYNTLHTQYKEIGVFGTAPALIAQDFTDVLRGYPITVGSYALAMGDNLRVDTLYREIPMTVKMVVEQFGLKRVSQSVKNMYENGNLSNNIVIRHAIEPNVGDLEYDGPESRLVAAKPIRSMYWEARGGPDNASILELRGYDDQPFVAPRWDITGTDTYGSSPGMEALGDVIQLQTMQRWKGEGIAKQVRPPMVAPEALRHASKSTIPGGITYYDGQQGMRGFEPAYHVDFQLQYLLEDIRETKTRISRAFYEDLFLMLAQSDRREITAREVEERHEEKLIMLGPVLERLEDELLDPMIDRIFQIALRNDLIPQPPDEMNETDVKVEYISILAQAQKAVAINSLERTTAFFGSLVQVQAAGGVTPDVLDKFNADEALDEYADAIGISPRVIRDQGEVDNIRAARAKKQQQAEQMAMAQQAVEMAAAAGTVKTNEPNLAADAAGAFGLATGQGAQTPQVGQP